ncbi:MAG: PAS domain S-box protein [Planctomycetes bacterium]|nr:PAS domain S-box protein [Planctomycetota bacterium]
MDGRRIGPLSRVRLVWLGVGLAALSWLIEALLAMQARPDATFTAHLLPRDVNELRVRVVVALLLIMFGIVAQATVGRWRRAEGELRGVRDELEQRVRERTAELTAANRRLEQEIGEREQAERALRASEGRFRAMVEAAPIPFLIARIPDGQILYVNAQFERVFEMSAEEALKRKTLSLYCDPDDRARLLSMQRDGEIRDYEVRARKNDGRPFWVVVSVRQLTFEGLPAWLAGFYDVSDRVRAEEQARLHQEELAHVVRVSTMGEMAAGLAHELNQPLAAITNYAQGCVRRLQSEAVDTDQFTEALEHVVAEARRAGAVIRRVRDFVRKREPRREAVHVNEVVRRVMKLAETEARVNQVAIRLNLAGGLPTVLGDDIQLEQVVLNLVRNGIEAMAQCAPEERHLTIATGVGQEGMLEVVVADAGSGLTPEAAERVFVPFYTTKRDGMGMGLSISQAIIEAHGGRLGVVPRATRGTTFRFTLPLEQGTARDGA